MSFHFFKKLLYTGGLLINHVVLVSGVQHSESVIHLHKSILFQILSPIRLLHNFEQNSLCYAVDAYWLFVLNIECVHVNPKLPIDPSPSRPVTVSLFYKYMSENTSSECPLVSVVIHQSLSQNTTC